MSATDSPVQFVGDTNVLPIAIAALCVGVLVSAVLVWATEGFTRPRDPRTDAKPDLGL